MYTDTCTHVHIHTHKYVCTHTHIWPLSGRKYLPKLERRDMVYETEIVSHFIYIHTYICSRIYEFLCYEKYNQQYTRYHIPFTVFKRELGEFSDEEG